MNLISKVKSKRMKRKEDAKEKIEKAEKSATKNFIIGSIMALIALAAVCFLIFKLQVSL